MQYFGFSREEGVFERFWPTRQDNAISQEVWFGKHLLGTGLVWLNGVGCRVPPDVEGTESATMSSRVAAMGLQGTSRCRGN